MRSLHEAIGSSTYVFINGLILNVNPHTENAAFKLHTLYTYLIDVMVSNDVIEASIEVIEEVNDLNGRAHRRQVGELNDVREIHSCRIEDFRVDNLAQFQLISYNSEN